MITSTTARPFASSVAPVAVLSTITSASSGGNTSVAPYESTNSAARPRPAIQRRAYRSYSDATTRGRAGSAPFSSDSSGAAATPRTGARPPVRPEPRHPIGAREAQVPAAEREHLHDVLGLERFRFGVRERYLRSIAPSTGSDANARIAQEGEDGLLHTALGEGESQASRLSRHVPASDVCKAQRRPPRGAGVGECIQGLRATRYLACASGCPRWRG